MSLDTDEPNPRGGLELDLHDRPSWKEIILALIQVGSFSFGPILSFWSVNVAHDPRVSYLLLIAASLFVFAGLIVIVVGRSQRGTLFRVAGWASVLLVALFNWKALGGLRRTPLSMRAAEHLLAIVLLVALLLIVHRFGTSRGMRTGLLGMAVVVLLASTAQLVRAELRLRPASLPQAPGFAGSAVPSPPPDVYYIVVDGYGRADVLRNEYGLDLRAFIGELGERNFVVPPGATANYPITTASIPSVLAMDLPLGAGDFLGGPQERSLNRIARGSNPVVRFLDSMGYRYVHIESGLPATRCGGEVDECVRWPAVDDTVLGLLESTPLAPLLKASLQRSTAEVTLERFGRIARVAAAPSAAPRFVFAHLLVPHPPLFLRADCSIDLDRRRSGTTVGAPPFRSYIDFRKAAYADQVRCVNDRLIGLLDAVPEDAVVVIAADHGPDAGAQLWKPVAEWTSSDILERMAIFSAFRLPVSCRSDVPDDVSLVNTFRVVFNCLFGTNLPLLPNRVLLTRTGDAVVESALP